MTNEVDNNLVINDYFLSIDNETLCILEKQGTDCMSELTESNIYLRDKAFKLITLLVAGVAGSFILATQTQNKSMLVCLLLFCIAWAGIAIYTSIKLFIPISKPLANTPPQASFNRDYIEINRLDYEELRKNGYQGNEKAAEVFRRYRLGTLQTKIEIILETNKNIAKKLSKAIYFTAIVPIFLCIPIICAIFMH